MSDKIESFVQSHLNEIGYHVTFDIDHESSPLEQKFKDSIYELLETSDLPEGFRNLWFFEEALIHHTGCDDLNQCSPYDFLVVYNNQIALVEIDGAYHFFHETNSSNIQLNERRRQRRMAIDRSKLEFSFASGISMLRIAYCDVGNMTDIISTFLNEIFFKESTVIMYSNEYIYQHLIPTDTSFVRANVISFYDNINENPADHMLVERPHNIDYETPIKECTPMFITDEHNNATWLRTFPVLQEEVY
jgi:hypothetical protein